MSNDNSKKRKRGGHQSPSITNSHSSGEHHNTNTSKPSNTFQVIPQGRKATLSIALPGSIIANTPGIDLKTILAGRLARAAALFTIDEIIIFEDGHIPEVSNHYNRSNRNNEAAEKRDPSAFLELLLSYAECPPNLRKRLFEYHPDLGKTGLLPPLDTPHHLKVNEWCRYREGVTVGSTKSQKGRKKGMLVDVGFPVYVPEEGIPPFTRMTVRFAAKDEPADFQSYTDGNWEIDEYTEPVLEGVAVDPAEPGEQGGLYWGYTVRRTASLSGVFTECPFEEGYDVSIGTSERGMNVGEAEREFPKRVQHALLVFGGVAGLEVAVEADAELSSKGIGRGNVGDLFDFYINVLPRQGSRTMRTEEAVWTALARLGPWLEEAVQ